MFLVSIGIEVIVYFKPPQKVYISCRYPVLMDLGDIIKRVNGLSGRFNKVAITTDDLFDIMDEAYGKPSIRQVIDQELPQIIACDPEFISKHNILLPENPEEYLFDLYHDLDQSSDIGKIFYEAKYWFRHISYYLTSSSEKKKLQESIENYDNIMQGRSLAHSETSSGYDFLKVMSGIKGNDKK
jgi:hypothetical protein